MSAACPSSEIEQLRHPQVQRWFDCTAPNRKSHEFASLARQPRVCSARSSGVARLNPHALVHTPTQQERRGGQVAHAPQLRGASQDLGRALYPAFPGVHTFVFAA